MRFNKKDVISWMCIIAGIVIAIGSIVSGLYLGLWICFVGGIVSIVNGFNHDPMNAMMIAIGVLKFFSAGIVGWLTFIIGISISRFFWERA